MAENNWNKDQNNENDFAKKRLEEIKKSNELIGTPKSSDFFVPQRKHLENNSSLNQEVIKPRKRKNLPFSSEEKQVIESTLNEVKSEYKHQSKIIKQEYKKLVKTETNLVKKVEKMNKKINNLINQDNIKPDQVEKTLELQEEYILQLGQVENQIKSIYDVEPNLSLSDRRKQIYSAAYNAETKRARDLLGQKKRNNMYWSNQVKQDKKPTFRTAQSWEEQMAEYERKRNSKK